MNDNDKAAPPRDANNDNPATNGEPPLTEPKGKVPNNNKTGTENETSTTKELRREFKFVEIVSLIINGVLAVVGIAVLCVYYSQLKTMQDQLFAMSLGVGQTQRMIGQAIEQTRAAEISADATKKSADTANTALRQTAISIGLLRQSNQINHDALVSVQRAFLTFEGFGILDRVVSTVDKNKWESYVFANDCENSGVTPAINVRHWNYIITSRLPLPVGFDFKEVGPDKRVPIGEGPTLIGPRSKKALFAVTEPAGLFQAVQERRAYLYFYGWVKYNDIFKNTLTHITRYCQQVDVARGDPVDANIVSIFSISVPPVCLQYACMDDQCKQSQQ